jgi:hypothetical protein
VTEIEATREMTRSEVAEHLRRFAAELDTSTPHAEPDAGAHRADETGDPRVTFMVGDDSATINPPEQLSFEVAVGSDGSIVGNGDHEVSFELAWQTDEPRENEGERELEIG